MKLILLIFIFMINHDNANCKVVIDSIKVYNVTIEQGLTTAGARAYFRLMENNLDVKKTIFIKPECLNVALNRSIVKKHFQTKLGCETYLFCMVFQGGLAYRYLICGVELIIDLSSKKNYWINNKDDSELLRLFIKNRH